LLALALAAGSASVATAAPPLQPCSLSPEGCPAPLSPAAAKAAAEATGMQLPTPPARAVSRQEAAAAASRPGAVTEGSPFSDKPLRSLASTRRLAVRRVDDGRCYYRTLSWQWGAWPYQQIVNGNHYWCGSYTYHWLTYRSTTVTLDGSFCGGHDAYQQKRDGGIYTPGVDVETGGYFDCPSAVPWMTLHYLRWKIDSLAWYGSSAIIWVS
jgi:hypothetical protein